MSDASRREGEKTEFKFGSITPSSPYPSDTYALETRLKEETGGGRWNSEELRPGLGLVNPSVPNEVVLCGASESICSQMGIATRSLEHLILRAFTAQTTWYVAPDSALLDVGQYKAAISANSGAIRQVVNLGFTLLEVCHESGFNG
jgi:hypothetical protein